jgi:hypothetical protein
MTALERVSKTGEINKPLLIYKRADQTTSWFSGFYTDSTTSVAEVTNERIFNQ